ncbi:hypothetical protein J5837_14925 [Pseudoxanthomonas helianthi]|uniref:Uncharacterized protein n=1 Tax=Pseudoxanthomonas helianthi TaxID=1453541 RepID=A0A940X468_9GAMM|nr:hypothetical protein [Pseudoxanthomonas helianthi]MBP3985703.1 hypothetical protein [Pseudoxanthomonas helianthi]
MRVENVEIYSDQTNAAVMRHPGRSFPGVLIQGDSLHGLCAQADDACSAARGKLSDDEYAELNELRNTLWGYLSHYKSILLEQGMPLPFAEDARLG